MSYSAAAFRRQPPLEEPFVYRLAWSCTGVYSGIRVKGFSRDPEIGMSRVGSVPTHPALQRQRSPQSCAGSKAHPHHCLLPQIPQSLGDNLSNCFLTAALSKPPMAPSGWRYDFGRQQPNFMQCLGLMKLSFTVACLCASGTTKTSVYSWFPLQLLNLQRLGSKQSRAVCLLQQ